MANSGENLLCWAAFQILDFGKEIIIAVYGESMEKDF